MPPAAGSSVPAAKSGENCDAGHGAPLPSLLTVKVLFAGTGLAAPRGQQGLGRVRAALARERQGCCRAAVEREMQAGERDLRVVIKRRSQLTGHRIASDLAGRA